MTDEEGAAVALAEIPADLQFTVDARPEFDQRVAADKLAFSLNGEIHHAYRPKDTTMIILGGAMSGMADGTDRAFAIAKFLHDCFDSRTRQAIDDMDSEEIQTLIGGLCEHWGQDTTSWKQPEDHRPPTKPNRAARRR